MKLVRQIFTEPSIATSFSIVRVDKHIPDMDIYHRLTYHRIIMIENGSGRLTIDNNSYEVTSNKIFLLSKGQVYRFRESSQIIGYIITFDDSFWAKTPTSASNCKAVLFNNTTANQRLQLNKSEISELSLLFNALLNEYNTSQYINQMDVLAAYLKIVMIKLANIKLTEESTFDSQDYILYRKFMELLSSHYRTYHAVNNYAKMLNITPRRLSELCKRCNGITAKEIINGQIVAEAKRSLLFSSHPVKEIAYSLNFNSSEQFSHFFKKNTTFAPADYRRKLIKKEL